VKPYIDIHTHLELTAHSNIIALRNILLQQRNPVLPDRELFSIGLHPWNTDQVSLDTLFFQEAISLPNCRAIGECGLDRLRGASLDIQTRLFKQQAQFAESVQKPVIIHCVRAWLEIIDLKAEIQPSVPWIIHGFRGKAATAKKLIGSGFYLSFGESILSMNAVLAEIVRETPPDRLFLETDGGKCPIEEVYRVASDIKNLPLEKLQENLLLNFEKVFGKYGPS